MEGGVIVVIGSGSGEVAAAPEEVGAVKVKMTARGRQRRMAQRRESTLR